MNEDRIEAIQTRWSLIREAHLSGSPGSADDARRLLVMRYASAIRRYVGAIVRNDDQADELSQDVLLRLMQGDFAGADPGRGRFRDLLKIAVRNMIRSHWEKSARHRTAEVRLDQPDNKDEERRESEWIQLWRRSVLDHTWNRMLADDGGKPGTAWHALKLRTELPDATSEDLASRLSLRIGTEIRADNYRQILKRARQRFVAHLLDEIRAGLDTESEDRLQEELAALGLLELVRESLPVV